MRFLAGIFSCSLLAACGNDAGTGVAAATITGRVELQDTWGNRLGDNGDVLVAVDNTSLATSSNADGSWSISGVPSGDHGLTFTKAGFGKMREPSVSVSGSSVDVHDTTYMARVPTYSASIDSAWISTQYGDSAVLIDGRFSASPPPDAKLTLTLFFFSATNDAVSSDPSTYDAWTGSFGLGALTEFTNLNFLRDLRKTYPGAKQVFVRAYPTSAACSCYQDPVSHKRIFTALGTPSSVVRFGIP